MKYVHFPPYLHRIVELFWLTFNKIWCSQRQNEERRLTCEYERTEDGIGSVRDILGAKKPQVGSIEAEIAGMQEAKYNKNMNQRGKQVAVSTRVLYSLYRTMPSAVRSSQASAAGRQGKPVHEITLPRYTVAMETPGTNKGMCLE